MAGRFLNFRKASAAPAAGASSAPGPSPQLPDGQAAARPVTAGGRLLQAAGVLCAAASLVLSCLCGGRPWELVLFWAALWLLLWLPGGFWFRALRLQARYGAIRSMLTLLLGIGFFAVCYCFAGRFGWVWLLRLVPLVFAAAELLCRRAGGGVPRRSLRQTLAAVPPLLWLLFGLACLLYSLYISVMNADPTLTGASYLNQDLLWNAGNAESFKLAFPPQDIRFSMVRLAYHYLTELTAGALSWATGISAYRVFAFYFGPPILAAVLLCLYQLGQVVYRGGEKKSLLFCLLTLLGGSAGLWGDFSSVGGAFGNTVQIHILTNINSQATAIIFISIFVALFTLAARRGFDLSLTELAVLAAAAFMMTFGKGPEAAIVICAFAIVMVLLLVFQRPAHPGKALVVLAASVGIFAVIYFMVFSSGANTSVHWSNNSIYYSVLGEWVNRVPAYTWQRTAALAGAAVALIFLYQPLQTFVYLVTLPQDVKNLLRLEPERLLARGAAVGGVLAYCILWHESSSQIYFAFVAFYFMNLLAADLLPQQRAKPVQCLSAALLCVGLISSVCLYGGVAYRGCVRLANYAGHGTVEGEKYAPATAGDVEAMEWLAEAMPAADRFATNRINTAPGRDDGISNLYSALSGRQAYMEGYTYAYTNEGVSEPVINERRANNDLLFSADSTAEQIRSVCAEIGVQWLVYSTAFPGSDSQLAAFPLVFANESVRIYQVS